MDNELKDELINDLGNSKFEIFHKIDVGYTESSIGNPVYTI